MEIDRIHLVRWFGCTFKQDCIIIHDSREFTPTTRSLVQFAYSLAWLVAHVYRSFLFICSCSNVGEERGLFSDGQVEWYGMVKLKSRWCCLQYLNTACSASGTSIRTAFQHRPGKLIFHFQRYVGHPRSSVLALNLLTCYAM